MSLYYRKMMNQRGVSFGLSQQNSRDDRHRYGNNNNNNKNNNNNQSNDVDGINNAHQHERNNNNNNASSGLSCRFASHQRYTNTNNSSNTNNRQHDNFQSQQHQNNNNNRFSHANIFGEAMEQEDEEAASIIEGSIHANEDDMNHFSQVTLTQSLSQDDNNGGGGRSVRSMRSHRSVSNNNIGRGGNNNNYRNGGMMLKNNGLGNVGSRGGSGISNGGESSSRGIMQQQGRGERILSSHRGGTPSFNNRKQQQQQLSQSSHTGNRRGGSIQQQLQRELSCQKMQNDIDNDDDSSLKSSQILLSQYDNNKNTNHHCGSMNGHHQQQNKKMTTSSYSQSSNNNNATSNKRRRPTSSSSLRMGRGYNTKNNNNNGGINDHDHDGDESTLQSQPLLSPLPPTMGTSSALSSSLQQRGGTTASNHQHAIARARDDQLQRRHQKQQHQKQQRNNKSSSSSQMQFRTPCRLANLPNRSSRSQKQQQPSTTTLVAAATTTKSKSTLYNNVNHNNSTAIRTLGGITNTLASLSTPSRAFRSMTNLAVKTTATLASGLATPFRNGGLRGVGGVLNNNNSRLGGSSRMIGGGSAFASTMRPRMGASSMLATSSALGGGGTSGTNRRVQGSSSGGALQPPVRMGQQQQKQQQQRVVAATDNGVRRLPAVSAAREGTAQKLATREAQPQPAKSSLRNSENAPSDVAKEDEQSICKPTSDERVEPMVTESGPDVATDETSGTKEKTAIPSNKKLIVEQEETTLSATLNAVTTRNTTQKDDIEGDELSKTSGSTLDLHGRTEELIAATRELKYQHKLLEKTKQDFIEMNDRAKEEWKEEYAKLESLQKSMEVKFGTLQSSMGTFSTKIASSAHDHELTLRTLVNTSMNELRQESTRSIDEISKHVREMTKSQLPNDIRMLVEKEAKNHIMEMLPQIMASAHKEWADSMRNSGASVDIVSDGSVITTGVGSVRKDSIDEHSVGGSGSLVNGRDTSIDERSTVGKENSEPEGSEERTPMKSNKSDPIPSNNNDDSSPRQENDGDRNQSSPTIPRGSMSTSTTPFSRRSTPLQNNYAKNRPSVHQSSTARLQQYDVALESELDDDNSVVKSPSSSKRAKHSERQSITESSIRTDNDSTSQLVLSQGPTPLRNTNISTKAKIVKRASLSEPKHKIKAPRKTSPTESKQRRNTTGNLPKNVHVKQEEAATRDGSSKQKESIAVAPRKEAQTSNGVGIWQGPTDLFDNKNRRVTIRGTFTPLKRKNAVEERHSDTGTQQKVVRKRNQSAMTNAAKSPRRSKRVKEANRVEQMVVANAGDTKPTKPSKVTPKEAKTPIVTSFIKGDDTSDAHSSVSCNLSDNAMEEKTDVVDKTSNSDDSLLGTSVTVPRTEDSVGNELIGFDECEVALPDKRSLTSLLPFGFGYRRGSKGKRSGKGSKAKGSKTMSKKKSKTAFDYLDDWEF